ncbi:MAG: hypothetical protein DWG76_05130 [Chloroflexi bacterium]|nr:hypothetical protein [Chloroflexota bacterium]
MVSKLDLLVVPLHRQDGQDQANLPGLLLAHPPRRAPRGRKDERLVLLLSIQGGMQMRPAQLQKLLDDMAQGYFQSQGSVTSALREQAERLNLYLYKLNQSQGKEQPAALARLTMLAVRGERVFLAQCGPAHAFLIGAGDIQHFYDPQTAGRGLGLSQTTDIRYYQTEVKEDDLLLAMPALPAGWSETTFLDVRNQKLATLRRRFLAQAGTDLEAVLLAAKPGTGTVRLMATSRDAEALETAEPARPITSKPEQGAQSDAPRSWEALEVPEASSRAAPAAQPLGEDATGASRGPQTWPSHSLKQGSASLIFDGLRERIQDVVERVGPRLRNFLLGMLPEGANFDLAPRTMALIAGLVPVAVVVLVAIIYLQVGRGQLYGNYMARAQNAAAAAEAREDPAEIREAWAAALANAQRAADYEATDEAAALVLQAQSALDDFDAIERLDFQLALFSALPDGVRITRMVATNRELYMLNSADGAILRAILTGGGYQLDEGFSCGPGPYGGYIVSALVDMALLPPTNPQGAALVAMDANGNLIYCIVDERPLATPLEAPDSNWGNPLAISVENENLYVLDPLTNAVWLYSGEEFAFVEPPRFYFGVDVPKLQDVIDIAVQESDLYLLDLEGQTAVCTFSDDIEDPTTCQDPADYSDSRPGREDGPQIEGAHFLQMQASDPPEPSIYILDPITPAVYQFSLRLSLVRQYRSESLLPEGVVTAFAVSPNRAIFLAFENELYIGFLP